MPRFLVVDDDAAVARGLDQLLRGDGHDVAPFVSGADAIAAMIGERFDVVLTDLEMPRTDGRAVVAATRTHQPGACVVVATAALGHEHELTEAGACFVADKPIDYDTILELVGRCRARGGHGAPGSCPMRSGRGCHLPTHLRRR